MSTAHVAFLEPSEKHSHTIWTPTHFDPKPQQIETLTLSLDTSVFSLLALFSVLHMSQDKTNFNIKTGQYTREIMYEGIHLMLQYSRNAGGEFELDGVLTPDGQNITDLVRMKALEYFESLL
jgi:hypothetical protein